MTLFRHEPPGRLSPLQTLLEKRHSGAVVAVALTVVALVLLAGAFIFGLGWLGSWRLIGFPSSLPPFLDFHPVLLNAARCGADPNGIYPYVPCAYATNAFNYPPVWLLLGKLGLTTDDTNWLAVAIEISAAAMLVYLLRGYSVRAGLIALPLILSPSIALAFERANIDLVEFVLVGLAAIALARRGRSAAALSFVLLAVAVVAKFLAVFCCAIALKLTRRTILLAVALGLFTAAYLYSLAPVLPYIRSITPVSPFVSYGYPIIFDRIELLYGPRFGWNVAGLTQSWVPLACVLAVLLLSAVWAFAVYRSRRDVYRISDGQSGIAFIFGVSIFLGTFLLLGTSFTYRLIFLLLALPQLFDWIETPGATNRASARLSYVILACGVVSLWLKFHPEKTLHINQMTDWMLFAIFTMLFVLNLLRALPRSFTGAVGLKPASA